jgi:hypothetical protein
MPQDYTFFALLLIMKILFFSLRQPAIPLFADTKCEASKYGVTRRSFLNWTAAAAMITAHPARAFAAPNETGKIDTQTMTLSAINAAIDVLIPADELTPSASKIGIGEKIVSQATTDPLFKSWLIEGLKWFDQGVEGSFVKHDVLSQTQLMQTLADSPVGSPTRIFFELLRLRTMTAYYADPRSLNGLVIERPPQPIGYPDFASQA